MKNFTLLVGWVERSDTHHASAKPMGFVALNPSYAPRMPAPATMNVPVQRLMETAV
ncbi:hypothetical protein [Pseudomonas citronellolis]|uniref:hypothetical protein n=1 Tax=Pseudomonas citronellolis TaxID=53408 RepID=UPI000B10177C|nr:hypothetical protein [Pseudomonas citronellolis]